MMIMPPSELMKYIATDENGEWIHSENMPKELEEMFNDFIEKSKAADKYKENFSK